jgi:TRAP-type uncharacterized transport system substrate-binding protein
LWTWLPPVAGVAAIALAFFFYFHAPRERTYHLRMTAGNAAGTRHHLAQMLKDELAPQEIVLELQETHGSEQSLDRVHDRTLDLALVQGGLGIDGRTNVRQVIALHVEPLHLVVKKELFAQVSARLSALEGKIVDLSEAGSGTQVIATDVLAFAGLRPGKPGRPGEYVPVAMDRRELFALGDPARLPDAVFLVSSLPSKAVRLLVTRCGYRLVALPFAEAFALDARTPTGPGPPGQLPAQHVEKAYTYAVSIPAFTYGIEPPEPPEPVPTLGARLLLVAHKDVDPQAVRTVLEGVLTSRLAKTSRPPIDARILELPPEYPWHAGTRSYLKRNTPLVSGALMDAAQKGFAILAAAASGLFVLWQWGKQRGQLKHDQGFHDYIRRVTQIEEQGRQAERSGAALADLLALEETLGRLKAEALDRFTRGELAGKELVSVFLVQANAARDHLARLVAEQHGRPPESVANEVPV